MKKHIEHLIDVIKILGFPFRYQDDPIIFGSSFINEDFLTNIHPPEMVMKSTNHRVDEVSYLDLCIKCNNDFYYYKSYDKRKEFPFSIINYPNLMGNVPINSSYGVFKSQLIWFSLINQEIIDFKSDVKSLINKLKVQGYNSSRL